MAETVLLPLQIELLSNYLAISSGPSINIFSINRDDNQNIIALTKINEVLQESWIRTFYFTEKRIITSTNKDNLLCLYEITGEGSDITVQQTGETNSEKRINGILEDGEGNIIIGDKTSRVFAWRKEQQINKELPNEEQVPSLLMGHCSVLTDIKFTKDQKYLLTSDKDNKIRISNYPKTYDIEAYCLGHTQFVSKVILLENLEENYFLSGSGDGTIRIWNYKGDEVSPAINLGQPSSPSADPIPTIPFAYLSSKKIIAVSCGTKIVIVRISNGESLKVDVIQEFSIAANNIINANFDQVSGSLFVIADLDPFFHIFEINGEGQYTPTNNGDLANKLQNFGLNKGTEALRDEIFKEMDFIQFRKRTYLDNQKEGEQPNKIVKKE